MLRYIFILGCFVRAHLTKRQVDSESWTGVLKVGHRPEFREAEVDKTTCRDTFVTMYLVQISKIYYVHMEIPINYQIIQHISNTANKILKMLSITDIRKNVILSFCSGKV